MDGEELRALEESLLKIAAGDSRGIDEIYDTIGGRMLSVAIGVVKNRALAEDVFQDAFLKLAQNAGKFRRRDNAYGWILTIVRNTALNKLKSERLRSGPGLEEFYDLAGERSETEDSENAVMVRDAPKVLTEEERAVVCDRYFLDLTVREIAKKRGIPTSTVARRLERAEARMRSVLAP